VRSPLAKLSHLDFLRNFDHRSIRRRPRAPARVLSYFPEYKGDAGSARFGDYYRVKMMLHHPFRDIKDLLNLDGTNLEGEGENADNWVEAYARCQLNHGSHESDDLPKEIQVPDDDEFEEASNIGDADDGPQASWQVLAAELPNRHPDRVEDLNLLGHRDIDRAYDWSSHVGKYPELDSDWWDHQKAAHPA
jgi:hypothetical protein